ncbi:hypothetical protein D3P08_24500 [Paenibacillus nanensis]|uniref:Uncharacterized protein n=1 Tax=Paenibacillus nanensis TaxID=393251 RepID=A0A3A1ULJ8_9BACL|nr:hypothetical protein D3P08_24500 [Paenibacillus nanensis]
MAIKTGKYEKQLRRTVWGHLIAAAAAAAVDKVYGIYSHGVDSAAMSWMFLYPLVGGALYCFIMGRLFPSITHSVSCRVFLNLHNSGIAALTIASLLSGVFEIAGTNSSHLFYYDAAGWGFIAAGLITAAGPLAVRRRGHQ